VVKSARSANNPFTFQQQVQKFMDHKDYLALAYDLFREAYEHHMDGELDLAVDLYRRSIETFPTAEAHTFLGWTYSFQGRLDEAIEECKKAIAIDPEFGNPYNDIGAYLIEKNLHEEAIPWLIKAARAKRYDNYHFAHYNLGRAYMGSDLLNMARSEFERALALHPGYEMARKGLTQVRLRIH
jgi:tetratricopeptide (TPR) repeat protein